MENGKLVPTKGLGAGHVVAVYRKSVQVHYG